MSGYSDMAKDALHADFIGEWTNPNEATVRGCPQDFRDQYRYTLARARAAEAEVRKFKEALRPLGEVLRDV